MAEARAYFTRALPLLITRFASLGSKARELSTEERLKILYDFFRPGEERYFSFDWNDLTKKGESFADYICPDTVEMDPIKDYIKLGDRYVRTLYLKHMASFISDDFLEALTTSRSSSMLSIDIISIPTEEAIKVAESRADAAAANIDRWQQRQNKNNNFSARIPHHYKKQREEADAFLEDLTDRDQRMNAAILCLTITADSLEELELYTENVKSAALGNLCQMASFKFEQWDGLKTVLPFGGLKVSTYRTLNTESLAAFMPFRTQEVQDPEGNCLGENAVSGNLIIVNRDRLVNQSAVIMGTTGSGKSTQAKWDLLASLLRRKKDRAIICDPEGEYSRMIEAMDLPDAAVLRLAAGSKTRFNVCEMNDGYGDDHPLATKTSFVLSLIEQVDELNVGAAHKSVIDRCLGQLFAEAEQGAGVPTLERLRARLYLQPEREAKEAALWLELYTEGSLNIFGHESNVDLKDKRIIVIDIVDLGEQLRPAGIAAIMEFMMRSVMANWMNGVRTLLLIDEFQLMLKRQYSASFFMDAWRQFRKRGAHVTAVTQNVEYVVDSVEGSTILSNSDLVVMMLQKPKDLEKLVEMYEIPPSLEDHLRDARPGEGLIAYGNSTLIPFRNIIPAGSRLYGLITTRPGEGVFGRKANHADKTKIHPERETS